MSYGFQMFDIYGNDVTATSQNVFIEEFLPVNGSGSKAYPLNPGEALNAFVIVLPEGDGSRNKHAVSNISVSGNTVSWSTVYGSSYPFFIIVVKSGVY